MPAKKRGTKKTSGGNEKHEKKMGGSGAAEHGINVFGGIGQQGPVSANDNTIAMKNISGGSRKGGSMLVDVGTPLVLTGLNQYMKRRSAKKGGKKVGGKCSLKGGKKVKLGGKPKSRKMMKKKMGGKRRSMKKKGRKMRGGELKCADGSTPVEENEEDVQQTDRGDENLPDDAVTGDGDENLPDDAVTLPPGSMSGGENINVTLPPGSMSGGENINLTLPPGSN